MSPADFNPGITEAREQMLVAIIEDSYGDGPPIIKHARPIARHLIARREQVIGLLAGTTPGIALADLRVVLLDATLPDLASAVERVRTLVALEPLVDRDRDEMEIARLKNENALLRDSVHALQAMLPDKP